MRLLRRVRIGRIQPLEHLNSEEARKHKHATTVALARCELMQKDAEHTIPTWRHRNSRPVRKRPPEIGTSVDIGIDGMCWVGWRMVGVISSNVVVERDAKFRKLPMRQVRTTETQMLLPPTYCGDRKVPVMSLRNSLKTLWTPGWERIRIPSVRRKWKNNHLHLQLPLNRQGILIFSWICDGLIVFLVGRVRT